MTTNKFNIEIGSNTITGDYDFGSARLWFPSENPAIATPASGVGDARYLPASGIIVIWDGTDWKKFTLKTPGMQPDDPSVVDVLASWLGTDAGTKVTPEPQRVGTWADQSPMSNDVSQDTDNLRPTVISGAKNGYDIVEFGGTQYMTGTWHTLFTGDDKPASVIAVVRCDVQNAGFQEFWSVGKASTDTPFFAFGVGQTGIRDFRMGRRDDAAAIISNTRADNIKVRDWQVVGMRFTGTECEMYVDGVTIFTGASGMNVGIMTVDQLAIGALLRTTVTDQFFGNMGEMAVYSSGLPGSAMSGISEYLLDKWGI